MKDIASIKEMLERRRQYMEEAWNIQQSLLKRQVKRSQYQDDLKVSLHLFKMFTAQLNNIVLITIINKFIILVTKKMVCRFQAINDQLKDLSEQLSRMKGHYGDSLNSALRMKNAFTHFKTTVEVFYFFMEFYTCGFEKVILLFVNLKCFLES